MNAAERAQSLLTARLLRGAASLDWLSTGVTLLAVAALLFSSANHFVVCIAVVLGLVARLYTIRINFDARLFEDLAEERLTVGELDGALVDLDLAPKKRTGRPIDVRCRGARRLVMIAAMLIVAQVLVLALATLDLAALG